MGKEYLRFDEIEDVLSSLDLLALVTPLLRYSRNIRAIGNGQSLLHMPAFKARWSAHFAIHLACRFLKGNVPNKC